MPKCTQCLDGDIVLFQIYGDGDGGHCNRCDAFFSDAAITEIQNKTVPILAAIAAADGRIVAAMKAMEDAAKACFVADLPEKGERIVYLKSMLGVVRTARTNHTMRGVLRNN